MLLGSVDTAPAGGAAIGQVIGATAAAAVLTAALVALGAGHRSGRIAVLGRLARFASAVSGLPGWAALPSGIAGGSLLLALFGMYWDISLHIDVGRDPGPLANPAHYFILAGLFGIFTAGFFAVVLPRSRPSRSAIRISGDWYAPLGGVLIMACAAFSLIGFPLDDIWHRLFGQDVTLWGPTHLMLIGGAAMTLIGTAVLLVEASRAARERQRHELGWVAYARRIALMGGLLIGLSTFQGEFDFGVPQFPFVLEPLMVMVAAAVALVAARVWLGAGAALGAALFFCAIRGALALLIGPVLGESTPHFPLYLPEALLVEAAALALPRRRPAALGLAAGAAIGTAGLAAEWGWSHVWSAMPWPGPLLPEGAILGFAGALAGGVVGAWVGARLASDELPRTRPLRLAAAAAGAAIVALVAIGLHKTAPRGVEGHVTLTTAQAHPREVQATVRITPASAASDAKWLDVTSWQGGGLVLEPLERTGPGTYRTTEPVPASGSWKTLVRIHEGDSLIAMPIYLPRDSAIPAPGVPAKPSFTRPFVADHQILQREQKGAVGWLWAVAYSLVGSTTAALLALLAWGLHRLAAAGAAEGRRPERRREAAAPGRPLGVAG